MSASSSPIRATVDTNLFVSSALQARGIPSQIREAWRQRLFRLVTSAPLEAAAEHLTPLSPLPIHVRDPKDDKVLACALGGQVDYLVSGDPDLLTLADEPAVGSLRIVTPRQFLTILGIDSPSR